MSILTELNTFAKTMRLESTLHCFSAIFSCDVISIFNSSWNIDHETVLPLAHATVDVLTRLLDVMCTRSLTEESIWTYIASSVRFLTRVGIVIAVDMMPIVMHFGEFCFSSSTDLVLLWQHTLDCALATCVNYAECIEWEDIEYQELSAYFSVIPFRTKQDHIGSVSVLRLLLSLKNAITNSSVQQDIVTAMIADQTPLEVMHRTLVNVIDGNVDKSLLATDMRLLLSCIPRFASRM